MSYSLQDTTSLSSLATAIRSKTGGSSQMTVEEMVTAVNSITAGSSSGGWIKRKEFYETTQDDGVATEIIYQSYLDLDTEIEEGKEWIFVFTTCGMKYGSTTPYAHRPQSLWLLYCDGSSVYNFTTLGLSNISTNGETNDKGLIVLPTNQYRIKFETSIDNITHTRIIRINNNTSTSSINPNYGEDINLGEGGYTNSNHSKYIWGNLFYLDESFDNIGTVVIHEPQNWGVKNNEVINALWDKLEFHYDNSSGAWYNLYGTFSYSGFPKTDWSSKPVQIGYDGLVNNYYTVNFYQTFYGSNIAKPPKINYAATGGYGMVMTQCFYNSKVAEITNDNIPQNLKLAGGENQFEMFRNCLYLQSVEENFMAVPASLMTSKPSNASQFILKGMYQSCKTVKELLGLPIYTYSDLVNFNLFDTTFDDCQGLHRITFYKPNGSIGTMNAINQQIDLHYAGFFYEGYNIPNVGDLRNWTGDSSAFYSNNTSDYLTNLDNPHYHALGYACSTYNRLSAVETLQSLPDTSSAIANNSGATNVIKFKADAGSAGGDDYDISHLSASEIAIATAKGWTVTFI